MLKVFGIPTLRVINRQKIKTPDEDVRLANSVISSEEKPRDRIFKEVESTENNERESSPNEIQTEEFQWCGITIRVNYHPNRWKSYQEVFGYPLAQLQIKAIQPEGSPLPVTNTGYLCLHLPPGDVEEEGGLVAYVKALLDYRAKFPEWILKQEAARQLNLF